MLKLRDGIVELYRKVATSLPPDVEDSLKAACVSEKKGSNARYALEVILENIRIARETARPICQDTGVPVFYVKTPIGLSQIELEKTIIEATRVATEKVPLRPNAVDIITDKNTGDNTGIGFPVIYFRETPDSTLSIDLMLKGSGCENVGQTYKLPKEQLKADRDLDGVRKCVLDAVYRAQGRGCSPYTIGVGIGAAKDQVTRFAKEQLMRRLTDTNNIEVLFKLEKRLLKEINTLGIGPLGFGGKTTALGVKIGVNHRHPASYFVDISVCCWANRRGRLIW
ncbi:MAG: fumarate hydratase [Thermodesulfovibrionales bacterium]|nr:fumarate hydratase [Thermodesulfovibrionales bacterium]MDP3048766.1 fumarate hydratase [Thermodesulfovibrionales bacterium]